MGVQTFRHSVSGSSITFVNNIVPFEHAILAEASIRAFQAVEVAEQTAYERMMKGPQTGKWYAIPGTGAKYTHGWQHVPGTGVLYRASAPGEWPAVRTGKLAFDLKSTMVDTDVGPMGVVGTDVPYGLALEFGRFSEGPPMLPRPWLSRAMYVALPQIQSVIMGRGWTQSLHNRVMLLGGRATIGKGP